MLHAVSLGRITVVDDTGPVQRLQVSQAPGPDGSPGLVDQVPHAQQFGFASVAPLTSEVVLVRLFGNRTLSLAIGTNHQPSRYRGQAAGDVTIYDVRGARVTLGPAGVTIDGAGQALTIQNVAGVINAPGATIHCQDVVTASVDLNTHRHTLVQAGTSESGPPG